MAKRAFTYIELVFVIVVIGILSVLTMERLNRDHLIEATDQVLSHIRYAQHLAMMDDQFNPTDQNYRNRWYRIQFHNAANSNAYSIYSDTNGDAQVDANDMIVRDPLSNKFICGLPAVVSDNDRMEAVDLETRYGVSVNFTNSNGTRQVVFDHLGRPHYSNNLQLASGDINVTLTANDGETMNIIITQETGYAYVQ